MRSIPLNEIQTKCQIKQIQVNIHSSGSVFISRCHSIKAMKLVSVQLAYFKTLTKTFSEHLPTFKLCFCKYSECTHSLKNTYSKCHFLFKTGLPVASHHCADRYVCMRVLLVNSVRQFPLTFPVFRELMLRQTDSTGSRSLSVTVTHSYTHINTAVIVSCCYCPTCKMD